MNWWISYGDKESVARGAFHHIGWMTLAEALDCARRQIAAGDPVIEITGPSGEKLNEDKVRALLHPPKISN